MLKWRNDDSVINNEKEDPNLIYSVINFPVLYYTSRDPSLRDLDGDRRLWLGRQRDQTDPRHDVDYIQVLWLPKRGCYTVG